MDDQLEIEILDGGVIKITTDLISDSALHTEAENFLRGVEKAAGNKFSVTANKRGGAVSHTHRHADGSTTTHAH